MAVWLRLWVLAPMLLIASGIGAFASMEGIRGDLAWAEYVLKAKIQGTKLTFSELLPPPVPEEENFGAATIFKRRLALLIAGHDLPPSEFSLSLKFMSDLHADFERCRPTDWKRWGKHFRELGWLETSEDQVEARDILRALDRFSQPLEELRTAAERPRNQFLVDWGNPMTRSAHWAQISDASRLLALRAEAQLEHGSPREALEDLRLIIRLARAMDREPGMMSGLTRINFIHDACSTVWSGLRGGWFDDSMLQQIDKLFATLDVPHHLRWMLESERALQNNILEHAEKGSPEALEMLFFMIYSTEGYDNELTAFSRSHVWFNQLRVLLNRIHGSVLARVDVIRQRSLPKDLNSHLNGPDWGLVTLRLPEGYRGVIQFAADRGWRAHTGVQQARIALALERYQLKHGAYPGSLSALVPEYLPAVPHDVHDGAPMRYRLDSSRRYVLHGIGADMKDDGGAIPDPKSRKRNPDWVWTYPAQ